MNTPLEITPSRAAIEQERKELVERAKRILANMEPSQVIGEIIALRLTVPELSEIYIEQASAEQIRAMLESWEA